MKLLSPLTSRMKKARKNSSESGFNMLEIVIGVGLMMILSAGGIVVFNGITDNAKTAAVESAASSVFTAAMAYDLDGDPTTKLKDAEDEYNNSQNPQKIKVTITKDGVPVGEILP